jgi:hypothetical protein
MGHYDDAYAYEEMRCLGCGKKTRSCRCKNGPFVKGYESEKKLHVENVVPELTGDLGYADVWHEGTKSFYHAKLLRKLTPEEALKHPDDDETDLSPNIILGNG